MLNFSRDPTVPPHARTEARTRNACLHLPDSDMALQSRLATSPRIATSSLPTTGYLSAASSSGYLSHGFRHSELRQHNSLYSCGAWMWLTRGVGRLDPRTWTVGSASGGSMAPPRSQLPPLDAQPGSRTRVWSKNTKARERQGESHLQADHMCQWLYEGI